MTVLSLAMLLVAGARADRPASPPAPPRIDAELARRIALLDCNAVSADDVRSVLMHAPTPHIILMHGSVAFVTMEPFARFLVAMGYPESRLRNPRDGSLTYSSFSESADMAGVIAWHYEHDGVAPMLVGHSQGGMLVVRTLHELAGRFATELHVVDPASGRRQARTTILDPLTGAERPVVGLHIGYAAALATGKLARFVLGQWSMLSLLRKIPDTVDDFVGFRIPGDLIAGDIGNEDPYVALGTANVRNVTLPTSYSHIRLPDVEALAADPDTRAFIEHYRPGDAIAGEPANLVHASILWYDIRRHWCLEAQPFARAR